MQLVRMAGPEVLLVTRRCSVRGPPKSVCLLVVDASVGGAEDREAEGERWEGDAEGEQHGAGEGDLVVAVEVAEAAGELP